jgi:hypothetical protein
MAPWLATVSKALIRICSPKAHEFRFFESCARRRSFLLF